MPSSSPPEHLAEVPLDLARSIEHTVALCRSVRAHLRHGPWQRTRRRVRRQLRRLADVLDRVQLAALSGPLTAALVRDLRAALPALDAALAHVVYHPLDKAELKALRRLVRQHRGALAAHVAGPASEAA